MNRRALMEKSPDADFLREMIDYGAQWLMDLDAGRVTGAAHGETSALVQRNGYRDRDWETRAGTVELRIPKLTMPTAPSSPAPIRSNPTRSVWASSRS